MCDDTRALVDYYAKRARYYESVYDKPERQDDLRRLKELVADRFFGADVFELACWHGVLDGDSCPIGRLGVRHGHQRGGLGRRSCQTG